LSVGVNASAFAKIGDVVVGSGVGVGYTTGAPKAGLNGLNTSFTPVFSGISSSDFSLITSWTSVNYHNGVKDNPFNQTLNQWYVGGKDWGFRYTNDQLFPVIGGGTDKGRTAGLELTIGNFSVGAEVGTSDSKLSGIRKGAGGSGIWGNNDEGIYETGEVYFSPGYVGFRGRNNMIHRVGLNHPAFQDITQNFIHKFVSKSPYFYTPYGSYSNLYVQSKYSTRFLY
jgi:hypothetical protein